VAIVQGCYSGEFRSVPTKHAIENESHRTKHRAACEKKGDEIEQSKQAPPGNHVGDEVIEELA